MKHNISRKKTIDFLKSDLNTIYNYFKEEPEDGDLLDPPSEGALDSFKKLICADMKMSVRGITLTFAPEFHMMDPWDLHGLAQNYLIRNFMRIRKAYYLELHCEFTEQGILHFHGIMAGSQYQIARFLAGWRRLFGHVHMCKNKMDDKKTPFTLAKWLEYCNKNNSLPQIESYHIPKKYVPEPFKDPEPKSQIIKKPKKSVKKLSIEDIHGF